MFLVFENTATVLKIFVSKIGLRGSLRLKSVNILIQGLFEGHVFISFNNKNERKFNLL